MWAMELGQTLNQNVICNSSHSFDRPSCRFCGSGFMPMLVRGAPLLRVNVALKRFVDRA